MRYTILAASVVGSFLAGGAALAQVKGQQYFGLGAGGGMVMHAQPCADIQCNMGDTCSCVNSSGTLTVDGLGGYKSKSASYTLEVSADNSTAFNNGGGGLCFGSTGYVVLTIGSDNLNIPFAGTGCRIGPNGKALGISAPAYIASGTGHFSTYQGSGSFSGTFNPDNQTVIFDISGFASNGKN